ncbi:MAG TPA: hypothetical protein VGJ60_00335 [Chloroflexota bacterium]|jgi:hypothetical protein
MTWVRDTLRRLAPPTQAVFLASLAGVMLGTAVPLSYLQQALAR